jgi:membrane associated rhomboid family serine protease
VNVSRHNAPEMGKAREHTFVAAVETSAIMVATLIVIKLVEWMFHISFAGFGILPRTKFGAVGIVFSPLIHANSAHLLANSVPLFILLILLFWDRHYHPYWTLAMIWIGSGLGTWLIARGTAVHIGASSVIFGLAAYLIVAGLLMKSWRSALVAVLVFVFFGGIFYGVLPQDPTVSWEGHLCGMITGIWAAKQNHA